MSSKSLRRQRRKVNNIKTTTTLDQLGNNVIERTIAVSSKKLTTSMRVSTTDRDHMPRETRIKPLVKPKQRVHSRVPEKGRVSKVLYPTSLRRICTQREPVVEHMKHEEFKATCYQHPIEMEDKPSQKYKVWYTGKGGVQCYDLWDKPQLKYRKFGAVRIDRVGGGKRSSINLEVGMNYLKMDPRTGKRVVVNRKEAVVTREEKREQRVVHAASKATRRGRKKAIAARNRARRAKLKFKGKLNDRLNIEELERLQRQLERNTAE